MKFTKIDDYAYNVTSIAGRNIGQLLREVDGYFVFYPEQRGGFWPEHMLIEIAGMLHTINANWNAEINQYFDAQAQSRPAT